MRRTVIAAAAFLAACSSAPPSGNVWQESSVSVSLTNGGSSYAPAFSECIATDVTWSFDATSGTATKTGCENGTPLARSGVLSSDQRTQLIALLSALKANPYDGSTVADSPEVSVVVTDSRGGSQNFSGIPWFVPAKPVPMIDSGSLFAIEDRLDAFIDTPLVAGEYCTKDADCAAGLSCRMNATVAHSGQYCQ